MNVFISWSGSRSKVIAEALRDWLPCVVQACEPWISSADIDAGVRWGSNLAEQLQKTHFGIICLTSENLSAPWILFEAGALSKSVSEANVCPYLFDVKPTDLKGPLAQFQVVNSDKEGTRKLVQTINRSLGGQKKSDEIIDKAFEALWSDLAAAFKEIPINLQEPDRKQTSRRKSEEMFEEILIHLRELSRKMAESESHANSEYILDRICGRQPITPASQKEDHKNDMCKGVYISEEEPEVPMEEFINRRR